MKRNADTSERFAPRRINRQTAPVESAPAIFPFVLALCLSIAASDAAARQTCDSAARAASLKTGVPLQVLKAITRSETGRGKSGELEPWPWTVNMQGVGKWFESRDAAQAYVRQKYLTGARSFDVGCFQINYKWHGAHFNSVDEMFEPDANALYAARFLKRLYAEKGDWSATAGAYHSRTRKFATRYSTRFDQILDGISGPNGRNPMGVELSRKIGNGADARTDRSVQRTNGYPLLHRGDAPLRLGSLVPLASTRGVGLFASNVGGS